MPTPIRTPVSRPALLLPLVLVAGGCGGDGGTAPPIDLPIITVEHLQTGEATELRDGDVFDGPVEIRITVDPPAAGYSATLNGEFFTGGTVSRPGSHTLEIESTLGEATSRRTLRFEIRLAEGSLLIVRMFDLGDNDAGGGGDAILVTDSSSAGQEHVLVDAGPAGENGADPGLVQRRLAALGVDTLELLLLTHAHGDHFEGMRDVLEQITVDEFLYNGQVRSSFSPYTGFIAEAQARADQVLVVSSLRTYELGYGEVPAVLTVIPPLGSYLDDPDADAAQINEESLGARLEKGTFSMFFTGDGEVEANQRWRTEFASLSEGVVALKVGHHGANDAVFDDGFGGNTTSTWLGHTEPVLQVISANGTSHPRMRALDKLLSRPTTETYCTNVHGDIEIRVDPAGTWTVTVQREAGSDCERGEDAVT